MADAWLFERERVWSSREVRTAANRAPHAREASLLLVVSP